MIHDATIEVTCDGEHCGTSINIVPEFVYTSYSGKSGHYDTDDSAIEEKLEHEGWLIEDGKHYCCAECEPRSEQAEEEE